MRRFWLLAAALALGFVGPASAQFAVGTSNGAKTATPFSPQPVDVTRMLPQNNVNRAFISPQGNARTFDFSRLLPNFSFTNNRWPLQRGYSQVPRPSFGPLGQKKN